MNTLSKEVLEILEDSNLGPMSVHVFRKQAKDIGLDLSGMTKADLYTLSKRLKEVLPFFIGEQTEDVLKKINALNEK